MKKFLALTTLALALTGCAYTEYAQYTSTQQSIMDTQLATTAGFIGPAGQTHAPQANMYTTNTSTDQSMDMVVTGMLDSSSYNTRAILINTTVFTPVVVLDVIVNQLVVVPDVIVINPIK